MLMQTNPVRLEPPNSSFTMLRPYSLDQCFNWNWATKSDHAIDSLFTLFTSYLVMLLYFACICILHYRVRFLSDVFKLEPNRRLPLFPWVKRFTCFDPYSQYSVMLVTCKDLSVITTNIVIVYSRATQHL